MNPWRSLRGLPRDVWVIFTALLTNRAGSMILALLALYATRARGWSATEGGLLVAAYGAGAILSAPLGGWLADRLGAVAAFALSLFASGLLAFAIPLGATAGQTAALVFLWSLAAELFRPASMVATARLVEDPLRRRTAFAAVRLALNLGISVGPAIGALLAAVSFRLVFLVDGVTSIAAGVLVLVLATPDLRRRFDAKAARSAPSRSAPVWRDLRYLAFCAATLPVFVVFFQFLGAAALHVVNTLGLPMAAFGFVFTLNTVVIILCEPAITGWTNRFRPGPTLAAGSLLIGLGYAAMAPVTGAMGVYATTLVWTLGEMLLMPGLSALAVDLSPDDRMGQYAGVFQVAFGCGFGLGPLAGTWIYSRGGPSAFWILCLAGGSVSAAAFWAIARGVTSSASTRSPSS
jgi:MFS family permease